MWNFENIDTQIKINPDLLEIVKRDNDFILLYGSKELTTPNGNPVCSTELGVIHFILTEISLNRKIDLNDFSAYLVYSYCIDFIESGNDFISNNYSFLIKDDYFFKIKILKQKPQLFNQKLLTFFTENLFLNNIFYEGFHSIRDSLNNFLIEIYGDEDFSEENEQDKFINFLFQKYNELSEFQKSFLNLLVIKNHRSLIIPFLLLFNQITAQQYIIAINFMEFLFNTDLTEKFDELLKESEKYYFRLLSVIDFAKYFDKTSRIEKNTLDLIRQGENTNVEFKSSLRWNIKENKKDSAIEHAVLKTICAFLNSKGGNLFIGVQNDGTILGIEIDAFENDDKFLLHLWNLIRASIGDDVSPYISTTMEKYDGKTICNVKCLRSKFPVFLRQKGYNEEFYIRIGPSCMSLGISDTIKYIDNHFEKK